MGKRCFSLASDSGLRSGVLGLRKPSHAPEILPANHTQTPHLLDRCRPWLDSEWLLHCGMPGEAVCSTTYYGYYNEYKVTPGNNTISIGISQCIVLKIG